MTETLAACAYQALFAQSENTDAILLIQGKKMHVNKALLSRRSDYFKALFNSDFKEKSMEEIPIEDVEYKDFAMLLSLLQKNPVRPISKYAEKLLELSDRFLLPTVKRYVELFVASAHTLRMEKIRLADHFGLNVLLEDTVSKMSSRSDFNGYRTMKLSDRTKAMLFDQILLISNYN